MTNIAETTIESQLEHLEDPAEYRIALSASPSSSGTSSAHALTDQAELLLQHMTAGDRGLHDLAQAVGVSLVELARLANDPASMALFAGIQRLDEVRFALNIGRYRSSVAGLLVNIAAGKDAEQDKAVIDLARKACVDFLSVELRDLALASRARAPARGEASDSHGSEGAAVAMHGSPWPHGVSAESILRAFDRLEQEESQALAALAREQASSSSSASSSSQSPNDDTASTHAPAD